MTDDTCPDGRPRKLISPAYVAGIIDGEGSIYVRYGNNPHISVANTSRALIDELARFGGYTHPRKRNRSIGNLPSWDWIISGEKAAIMIRACLPYLIIKQDKALAALASWDAKSRLRTNHYMWAARARDEMLPLLDKAWLPKTRRANVRGQA